MMSIGLMSGTSMDGIDAALLETDGTPNTIRERGETSIEYEWEFKVLLKAAEYAIREAQGNIANAELHFPTRLCEYLNQNGSIPENRIAKLSLKEIIQHSTELHYKAVQKLLNKVDIKAQNIDVIGYHGQAMYHFPERKISVVVGDGQLLCEKTGITVVNDFRSLDVAAGGQGAPFAPLYHQALAIRDQKIPLVVVNCGGIANVTLISDEEPTHLMAFDTGPGNGLLDRFVFQSTGGVETMDFNGKYGLQGQVKKSVLEALYKKSITKNGQNYFLKQPPKSLDIGDLRLIEDLKSLSLPDGCATLAAFTADCIVQSLDLTPFSPTHWILAGGGWKNPVILRELKARIFEKWDLPNTTVRMADEVGWNAQALEAQIFAYLAVRALKGLPLSMPGTTGVPHALTGGTIYKKTQGIAL